MEKQSGIVIKTKERNNRILILDRIDGMMEYKTYRTDLSVGTLIAYNILSENRAWIHQVDICRAPSLYSVQDLLFVHHMLEICLYFLPIGMYVAGVFDVMHLLYADDMAVCTPINKKIIVGYLLFLFGFYSEDSLVHLEIQRLFKGIAVDKSATPDLDLGFEQSLHQWLQRSIAMHPKVAEFKTLRFLQKE